MLDALVGVRGDLARPRAPPADRGKDPRVAAHVGQFLPQDPERVLEEDSTRGPREASEVGVGGRALVPLT